MSTTQQKLTCPKCGVKILSWQVRCRNCGELLDKDAGKYIPTPGRRGGLWWFAMIVGIVGVGVWTWAMVGLFKVGLLLVFMVLIPWASLALTWKWSSVGGVLLIIAGFYPLFILEYISEYLGVPRGALGLAPIVLLPSYPLILLSSVLFIFSRRAW